MRCNLLKNQTINTKIFFRQIWQLLGILFWYMKKASKSPCIGQFVRCKIAIFFIIFLSAIIYTLKIASNPDVKSWN